MTEHHHHHHQKSIIFPIIVNLVYLTLATVLMTFAAVRFLLRVWLMQMCLMMGLCQQLQLQEQKIPQHQVRPKVRTAQASLHIYGMRSTPTLAHGDAKFVR